MVREVRLVDNIKCVYEDGGIRVTRSYRIPYERIHQFSMKLRSEIPGKYRRPTVSWDKELIAHKFLYDMNICTDKMKDTVLSDQEKWYKLLIFNIICFFYKLRISLSM